MFPTGRPLTLNWKTPWPKTAVSPVLRMISTKVQQQHQIPYMRTQGRPEHSQDTFSQSGDLGWQVDYICMFCIHRFLLSLVCRKLIGVFFLFRSIVARKKKHNKNIMNNPENLPHCGMRKAWLPAVHLLFLVPVEKAALWLCLLNVHCQAHRYPRSF